MESPAGDQRRDALLRAESSQAQHATLPLSMLSGAYQVKSNRTRTSSFNSRPRSFMGHTVYDQDNNVPLYGKYATLQEGEQAEPPEEVKFKDGATDCIVPYRSNTLYQFFTILTILISPFYFMYIWQNRRTDSTAMQMYSIGFFLEELIYFLLNLCSRLTMWYRQRRYVRRLDKLSPAFPQEDWPKVHMYFTHYAEPIEDSIKPLKHAVKQQYPPEKLVVTILDDGYYKRNHDGTYSVTPGGTAMLKMIEGEMEYLARLSNHSIDTTTREVPPESCKRLECAPGGCTVITVQVPGLPIVRLVGRKKGVSSHMKTGNLENGLWNVMEEDVPLMVVLDTDMSPEKDMLQYLLPPFFKHQADHGWSFDWETAFVSSPQTFSNIEKCYGTDDPLNQMRKSYWRELPAALDNLGLVHFWGTNTAFFAPALRDSNGFVYGCITEDTVTGATLHKFGWKSSFVGTANISLATGLCRETLTETCDQRKRWSQGNMQQFFMENAPRCTMSHHFLNAPYRQQLYDMCRRLHELDRRGELPAPISPEDSGVQARRARRSLLWDLRREIAYFPCKYGLLSIFQPIGIFVIALTMSLSCKGPFLFDFHPVHSIEDFLFHIWIVFAYWSATAMAQLMANSYQISDPNNPCDNVWREQQDTWAFTWIRLLGSWQGAKAAITGKQPVWNAFGMVGGVNLTFELPNLVAFLVTLGSVTAVVLNYIIWEATGDGWNWLPGPDLFSISHILGCQIMSVFVMINLWPVTSCTIADLLMIPPYTLRSFFSTFLACIVQVAAAIAWVLAYGEIDD